MGRVYRATHLKLGEPVAVKFLTGPLAEFEVSQERFRREAQVLARIRHPGIVSVLDFGAFTPEGGNRAELFMVMELVKGVPLADRILPQGPAMSLQRIAQIFDQLLAVLEVAHGEGIVHRDLKPENVMLIEHEGQNDLVKILDFGLALDKSRSDPSRRLTETGTVHGTPHYMSPEQCRGTDVAAPTDIYAVGCMLFEALEGVPPFDATDIAALMAQQMFVEAPAPADVGYKRELSPGLVKVLRRALAKSADARPTAHEMRAELHAAFAGTDADALMARAAIERVAAAGLSREDRALTGVAPRAPAEAAPLPAAAAASVDRVVLWADDSERAREVRDALSVAGLRVTLHVQATPPPSVVFDDPVRGVLVAMWARSAAELAALCEHVRSSSAWSASGRVPVLCVGARDAAHLSELIRAGATDALLTSAAKDEIAKKTKRALKRRA
jgi:serine/threonine-protein kinase